jgi:hypothetical protein
MPFKDLIKEKEYRKKYHRIWYLKNRTKKLQQNKEWENKNKEHAKEYRKKWAAKNQDKVLRAQEKYKKKVGAEVLRKRQRLSLEKNRKKRKLRKKERLKNDINFRLRERMSVRIRNGLNFYNLRKHSNTRTVDLLGCSYEYYSRYLEKKFKKGMSWKNFGKFGWEIDHIKPLARFNLEKISERKKAFNYKNTQPLWRRENRLKADK